MRIKNLITAALMLMFSIGVFAQYSVNLNGIVVNAQTGQTVPNQTLTWWFSPNGPVTGGPTGTLLTDTMGMFSDSVSVFTPSGWFLLTTTNCDGSTLTDSLYYQNNVSGNFITTVINYCDTGNVVSNPGPCNSTFNYIPGTGSVTASFFAVYAEPGTFYYWDFGDGNYDTTTSPITNHQYTGNPGAIYNACLTVSNSINACNSTNCLMVTLPGGGGTGSGNAVISGQIWVGQQLANSAKVYLIDVDTISSVIYLTAVDSINTTQGIYSFDSIPAGSYIIKAALNPQDPNYANYIPTFAGLSSTGSGSALIWTDAVLFGIYPNTIANYTSSVFMEAGSNPGGPGFVSGPVGTVSTPQSVVNGFVGINNGFANSATVYLIEFDTTLGGILTAIDSAQTQQGFYQFDSVPQGWYLVKAALNSNDPDFANYLPTYFGAPLGSSNSSTLFWFNSSPVVPTPNAMAVGYGIQMIQGNNPGGPGFIGGLISQGANKTTDPGDGIENVLVLLLDNNDNPVDYTYSDKDGKFEFSSIPYGDYKVYTEVSGLTTQEVFVTVDAQNPKVDLVDVIISSSGVNGSVGVRKISASNNVLIYPNPAKDNLTIDLGKEQSGTLQIINLTGKVIISETIINNTFNVDLQNLSSGIYHLSISSQGKLFQTKLIKE